MNKITFLFTLCLFTLFSFPSFAQTFDLTTVTNNGLNGVSETLSGVTMTVVTKDNGANNTNYGVIPAFGTNGVAFHSASSTTAEEMTISFNTPVNVSTIRVISDITHSRTWTFTPTGGSNTIVTETNTFAASTDVALNFTAVSSITITSNFTGGLQERIVLDQLTLAANTAPTVTTTAASTITATAATLAGNATADGGAPISERGIVYAITATNANPLISGTGVTKNTNGTTIGVFSESITSLTAGTQYSYKAYAINSVGTSYGAVQTFTTLSLLSQTINFDSDGFVTNNDYGSSIYTSGNIRLTYSSGNYFEHATAGESNTSGLYVAHFIANETITIETIDGTEIDFQSFFYDGFTTAFINHIEGFKNLSSTGTIISGFIDGTNLLNSNFDDVDKVVIKSTAGFFSIFDTFIFGPAVSSASTPTVTTTAASTITATAATLAGNATADGGAPISERGIVYAITATNANPLISGTGVTKNTNGTTIGVFSESITSLTAGTQYSYKAYAINSVGTSYGAVQTFTTTKANQTLTFGHWQVKLLGMQLLH